MRVFFFLALAAWSLGLVYYHSGKTSKPSEVCEVDEPSLRDGFPVPEVKEVVYTFGGTYDGSKTGFFIEADEPGMYTLMDSTPHQEVGKVWYDNDGRLIVEVGDIRVGVTMLELAR